MPGKIPKNFSNTATSNRGITEQSKINCVTDPHLPALKASTLRNLFGIDITGAADGPNCEWSVVSAAGQKP